MAYLSTEKWKARSFILSALAQVPLDQNITFYYLNQDQPNMSKNDIQIIDIEINDICSIDIGTNGLLSYVYAWFKALKPSYELTQWTNLCC